MAGKYSDNFWFERFLFSRGITFKQGRAGMYITNLTNVIGEDYYGQDFLAHKNDDAAGIAIFPIYARGIATESDAALSGLMLDGINPGVKQALNLMAAGGHSANTLLGKEWDIQTVARIYAPREDSSKYDPVAYKNEKIWKELGEKDGHIKVSEFVDMLTAEWLVENTADADLESKLFRANEMPLTTLAKPVTTLNGEERYAPFVANSAGAKKTISMEVSDESFKKALGKMQKVFGVKMVMDKTLDASQTVVQTKGRLGRLADRLADGYRRRSNKPLKSIGNISAIHYGQDLKETDKATQLYTLLKTAATRSMAPYQAEVLRTLGSGKAYNLPKAGIKDEDIKRFEGATAAYIASEIVYMFVGDKEVAKQLHQEFRMDAANQLASFSEDNTWAVSLMSGVVDLTVNATAYDARFTPQNYAEAVGLPVNNYNIMDQVLFAKRKYPKLSAEQIAERKEAVAQYCKEVQKKEAAEIEERLKRQVEEKNIEKNIVNDEIKKENNEVPEEVPEIKDKLKMENLKKILDNQDAQTNKIEQLVGQATKDVLAGQNAKTDIIKGFVEESTKDILNNQDAQTKIIADKQDEQTEMLKEIYNYIMQKNSGSLSNDSENKIVDDYKMETIGKEEITIAEIEKPIRTYPWDEYSQNFVERVYYGEKDCVAAWKKSCERVSKLLQAEHRKASEAYLREDAKLKQMEESGQAGARALKTQKDKLCESRKKLSMISKIIPKFTDSVKKENIMQVFDDSEQKPEYAAVRELRRVALNIAEDIVQEAGADMATYENKSAAATISAVIKNRNTAQVHKGIVEGAIRPIAEEAEDKRSKQPDPCVQYGMGR